MARSSPRVTVTRFPSIGSLNLLKYAFTRGLPYFFESAAGVQLSIDPTSAGWTEGDTGTVWMLADFLGGHWLDCGFGDEFASDWVECGTAEWATGDTAIVTDPLPVLGWVGLVKDEK